MRMLAVIVITSVVVLIGVVAGPLVIVMDLLADAIEAIEKAQKE
jgi:hypothetical protein